MKSSERLSIKYSNDLQEWGAKMESVTTSSFGVYIGFSFLFDVLYYFELRLGNSVSFQCWT